MTEENIYDTIDLYFTDLIIKIMSGVENQGGYETREVTIEQIEASLDALEEHMAKDLWFELSEEWDFYLTLNWDRLNIPLTPENLSEVVKLTDKIMDICMKEWYKWYEFYSQEDWLLSVWSPDLGDDKHNNTYMDLKVNNRFLIGDTTILSDEGFTKVFWRNPSRWNDYVAEYARFLNKFLWA